MSTTIRPVIRLESPYYISKERFYELKHFCLQYGDYKRRIAIERVKSPHTAVFNTVTRKYAYQDETGSKAAKCALYGHYIEMIEGCAKRAGGDIYPWIFDAVTKGKSYATLYPPCSKNYFYIRYRRFFWMLDKER